jgi:hypothetical protein
MAFNRRAAEPVSIDKKKSELSFRKKIIAGKVGLSQQK